VGVEHALGPAGGARRVADGGRATLVRVRPAHRLGPVDQRLVIDRAFGDLTILRDDDHVLEFMRGPECVECRQQRLVDHDCPVAGVARDEPELVGVQARIERVDHRPHRRQAEIQLEVLGLVPEQRPDPVALADPELGERAGKAPRASRALPHRRAMDRPVGPSRDDLAVAGELFGALDYRRQRQRIVVHHQPVQNRLAHALPPCCLTADSMTPMGGVTQPGTRQALSETSALKNSMSSGCSWQISSQCPSSAVVST